MQYLLIIQIGPVQEFIATARKSRDLWFGSWLLSELAKAAAHEIAIQNELESLIFPWTGSVDDLKVDSELNVGNKIVAVINKPPASFCQEVHASIQKRLRDIREQAYSGIASAYFLRDIAEKQVDDLLEFYWVAVPFENEQAYQKTRITAEQLLAARKATRDFQPVTWGSNAPKSSLDGQRESVIHEEIYPCRTATPEQRKEIAHKLYLQYRVNEGERLCGIGLLKRHGESKAESKAFFSTSHVAALPLIARLKASDSQAVETYMNALNNDCVDKPNDLQRISRSTYAVFPYDGQWLFAERLHDLIGENAEQKAALDKAKDTLKKFLEATVGKSIKPTPYYALLLADGDGMGKAIDNQTSPKEHRQLSQQLAMFAQSAKAIVETTHKGSLVYAGGDDVLAFVPLHTVLACARELAERFEVQMKDFKTTLSVGIAVTHHIEPMSDALSLAREAEKAAKKVTGKNALAITVSKRSGADRTIAGKWGELDHWLDGFVVLHRQDAIPDGAAYELHALGKMLKSIPSAIPDEAMRILGRKRPKQGRETTIDGEILQKLECLLKSKPQSVDIEQLANQLIIAKLFADATEQAGMVTESLPGIQFFQKQEANAECKHG